MSSLIFDSDTQGLSVVKEEEINEATGKSEKKYKIRGVFSTIGEKNRNGRTYPRPLWERNVAEYQNEIKSGSINTLMEYEHPARTEVDPMKAVSKITKLWIEGQYVMGEAVLLDNPQANQLKSLVDNDVKISVSSRGVGSVKNGIVESFKLITYDVVPNPSDYNATMNGMCEAHRLCEGIVQDKTYEIDKFGNIIEKLKEPENSVENIDEGNVNNVEAEIKTEPEISDVNIQEQIENSLKSFKDSLKEDLKNSLNEIKESLKPEPVPEVQPEEPEPVQEQVQEQVQETEQVQEPEEIKESITLAQKQDAIRELFENFLQKI